MPRNNTYAPLAFCSLFSLYSGVMDVFFALLHNFVSYFSAIICPDVSVKFSAHKLASAEGSFVSSMEKAASAWARVLTWSQPTFSRMAEIPLAPQNAQTSPRSLRISSKASASSLIHSITPSGSPHMKLSLFE
jgi:hypothetical protein